MIYSITHTSTYDYTDSVSLSHHLLRLTPRGLATQKCLGHQVQIEPAASVMEPHLDYYGNDVTFVTIEGVHQQLIIRALSRVSILSRRLPIPSETLAWENVREFSRGHQIGSALEASEFIFDSALIKADEEFANYAAPSFAKDRPVFDAVLDLTGRIHEDFKFDPKATTLATPLEEVFRNRRGVCQDFAQMEIACLRSLGLPARYVSGYLETDPPAGQDRLIGADASHAWISFYCHGIGWIDIDPTNNLVPSTRHITIAYGRDYNDVSPVRGVILGTGTHTVSVAVDVQAIDASMPMASSVSAQENQRP